MRYVVSILLLVSSAVAQDATVTFYSAWDGAGRKLANAVGVPGRDRFAGLVFDGEHKLGGLLGGRFMTLRLPAGPHTFALGSAWSTKRPSEKEVLPIALE